MKELIGKEDGQQEQRHHGPHKEHQKIPVGLIGRPGQGRGGGQNVIGQLAGILHTAEVVAFSVEGDAAQGRGLPGSGHPVVEGHQFLGLQLPVQGVEEGVAVGVGTEDLLAVQGEVFLHDPADHIVGQLHHQGHGLPVLGPGGYQGDHPTGGIVLADRVHGVAGEDVLPALLIEPVIRVEVGVAVDAVEIAAEAITSVGGQDVALIGEEVNLMESSPSCSTRSETLR